MTGRRPWTGIQKASLVLKLLADGTLLLLLATAGTAGIIWLVRCKPDWRRLLPYAVMAGLTSLLAGKLMSFWQPDTVRPFVKQGVEAGAAFVDNPGFPSDHVLLSVVVVVAIYFLTPYKKLSYVLTAVVATMAVARVLALVHTPFDIVGGVVAGLFGIVWYFLARERGLLTKHK